PLPQGREEDGLFAFRQSRQPEGKGACLEAFGQPFNRARGFQKMQQSRNGQPRPALSTTVFSPRATRPRDAPQGERASAEAIATGPLYRPLRASVKEAARRKALGDGLSAAYGPPPPHRERPPDHCTATWPGRSHPGPSRVW